jgi:ectoine hydroxylase-related dioxygenase (phytanoyl-CoA dioxygenase family)
MIDKALTEKGYLILASLLGNDECDKVVEYVSPLRGQVAGTRNLLVNPWCKLLAARIGKNPRMASLLPPNHRAVQCTYFEKSPDRNWAVAFHQDLSIPVNQRVTHEGCTGWSEKEGVLYTQPPVNVLQQLVGVRLHLDECGSNHGPLRVIPSSHLSGRIHVDSIGVFVQTERADECLVQKGGVLVLRPLLLHASSKAKEPSFRRVLHFLFGPPTLEYGLAWPNSA